MQPAESFVLENGMKFVVAGDHAVPVAGFGILARAGSCEEPAEKRGIAHFLEHMMFRGSENYASKEHTRIVTCLGGECNAGTSQDYTFYWETLPGDAIETAFKLESDRFLRLKLAADLFDVEKKVILEEIRVYENQPVFKAMMQVLKQIAGEHPYALFPGGLREHMEACSIDDIQAFFRNFYNPDNCFGIVVGDVEPARVRDMAEKYFSPWQQPGNAVRRVKVPDLNHLTGVLSIKLPLEVPVAVRAHRLRPSATEDNRGCEMLAGMIAGNESSPLNEELVIKSRMCVHTHCESMRLVRGGSLIFAGVFLPPGNHASRRDMMKAVCDRFVEKEPDPVLFESTMNKFRKQKAQEMYSVRNRMSGYAQAEIEEGDFRKYETSIADLSAVTPDRIRQLGRRLFAGENTLELDLHPENLKWWMPLAGLVSRLVRR